MINSIEALILFVSKKNNNLRLYVNYYKLNKIIIKNQYSLSLINEILNYLNNIKYFIKLNLKNVYYCIRIRKSNEWKITFRTRYEHFKYLIILFNLTNTSIIFQTYINKSLINLIDYFYIIYLNNILIYFNSISKYIKYTK